MRLVSAGAAIGRALILPPGVPADRLAALRAAFDSMVQDPDFRADAAARRLEIAPTPDAAVQTISDAIVAAPAPIVAMVREAVR